MEILRTYEPCRSNTQKKADIPEPPDLQTDVISVNRYLCNGTVVGTLTTFGIGRRTDVDGRAGSSFAMMISHGQKGVVVQVVKM